MLRASMLTLCAVLALAACGGSPRPAAAPTEARQDELIRYRAALADLRRHPLAAEATVDLEKAEAWLETVQNHLASDPDGSRVRLYLDAIKAQLIKVKSFYARREAQRVAPEAPGKDSKEPEGTKPRQDSDWMKEEAP